MHIVFLECNICLYFKDNMTWSSCHYISVRFPNSLFTYYYSLEYFGVKLRTVGIAKSFCISSIWTCTQMPFPTSLGLIFLIVYYVGIK